MFSPLVVYLMCWWNLGRTDFNFVKIPSNDVDTIQMSSLLFIYDVQMAECHANVSIGGGGGGQQGRGGQRSH